MCFNYLIQIRFDFILVILSIPTFISSSFQVVSNLRVLRLARLAKLIRLANMQKQLDAQSDTAEPNTTITLKRLSGLLFDLITPMINNILIVLIIMYMYSIIGMQFFVFGEINKLPDFQLKVLNASALPNATAVEPSLLFADGKYLGRMNFNCFGKWFVNTNFTECQVTNY